MTIYLSVTPLVKYEVVNDITLGCQTSDSSSSLKFLHLVLLALLVALVSHSLNFHHRLLLTFLVALVLH